MRRGGGDGPGGRTCADIVAEARAALSARVFETSRPQTGTRGLKSSLATVRLPPIQPKSAPNIKNVAPPSLKHITNNELYKKKVTFLEPPASAPMRLRSDENNILPPLRNGRISAPYPLLVDTKLRSSYSELLLPSPPAQNYKNINNCNVLPPIILNKDKTESTELEVPRRVVLLDPKLLKEKTNTYRHKTPKKEQRNISRTQSVSILLDPPNYHTDPCPELLKINMKYKNNKESFSCDYERGESVVQSNLERIYQSVSDSNLELQSASKNIKTSLTMEDKTHTSHDKNTAEEKFLQLLGQNMSLSAVNEPQTIEMPLKKSFSYLSGTPNGVCSQKISHETEGTQDIARAYSNDKIEKTTFTEKEWNELTEHQKRTYMKHNMTIAESMLIKVNKSTNILEIMAYLDALFTLVTKGFIAARSSKLNALVISSLSNFVESERGEIALKALRVLLALKLRGVDLANVCRSTFRLASQPENVAYFLKLQVIGVFIATLGTANPQEDAEACAWAYGAAQCLVASLSSELIGAGIADILRLHLFLLNTSRSDTIPLPLAAGPATRRLAAVARVLVLNEDSLEKLCRSGLISELVNLVSMWPPRCAECFEASRVLSVASDSPHACVVLFPLIGKLLNALARHYEHRGISVRLAYCIGNVLAHVPEAPSRLLSSEGSMDAIEICFKHYLKLDVSSVPYLDVNSSEEENKIEKEVEDNIVKIIRIVANLALDPKVSSAIFGNDGTAIGSRILDDLVEVIRRKGPSAAEAVGAALAAVANIAYGVGSQLEGPLALSRVKIARAVIPLIYPGILAADASRALANLCTSSEVREYAVESGAVEALCTLVKMAVTPTKEDNLLELGRDNCSVEENIVTKSGAGSGDGDRGDDIELSGEGRLVERGEAAVGALVNLLGDWSARHLFARVAGPTALVALLSRQPSLHLTMLTCQALENFALDSSNLRDALGSEGDTLEDILEEILSEGPRDGDSNLRSLASDILKKLQSDSSNIATWIVDS